METILSILMLMSFSNCTDADAEVLFLYLGPDVSLYYSEDAGEVSVSLPRCTREEAEAVAIVGMMLRLRVRVSEE